MASFLQFWIVSLRSNFSIILHEAGRDATLDFETLHYKLNQQGLLTSFIMTSEKITDYSLSLPSASFFLFEYPVFALLCRFSSCIFKPHPV